jgi:hypothetical protein
MFGSQTSLTAILAISSCLSARSVDSVGGSRFKSAIARSINTMIGFSCTFPDFGGGAPARPREERDLVGLRAAADAGRVFLAGFFFDTRCSSLMRNLA